MCDLGVLINYLFDRIDRDFVEEQLVTYSIIYIYIVLSGCITYFFQVAGTGMMLIISVLRYRATVHHLIPAISRRKLNVFCGLVYIVGFIAGCGTYLPPCFMQWNNVAIIFNKVSNGYLI
jgi:hypothetical protein